MNNPNEISADDYRNSLKPAPKIATKLKKLDARGNVLTSAQFRRDYVDQDEHDLQSLGVEWFRLRYPGILIYAIPNAAERSVGLTGRMIDEGLVPGMPDLHVAYPHNGKPGLYIETKTVNGEPSHKQIIIHAHLRAVGYEVIMPQTFEEFQAGVNEYMH